MFVVTVCHKILSHARFVSKPSMGVSKTGNAASINIEFLTELFVSVGR
jgi:hypothetical protein